MSRYLLKRLVSALVTLWLLATIVFAIVNVLPGNIGRKILGPFAPEAEVVAFNQRLGNLHFEIAADFNRTSAVTFGEPNRDLPNIYIDINRVLPNGQPNDNFLQAYGDGQFMRGFRTFTENNGRAAVAYVLPTRFGHFTFNSLGGSNNSENTSDHRYLSVARGTDQRQWAFSNQRIRIRRYWNTTSRPSPELAGRTLAYVDPNTNLPETVSPIWAIEADRRDTQNITTNRFNYEIGRAHV